ncbi:cellulose synthase (UDP-forming) [Granulicella rosea]|uniref:Cellulose synthase catalytic subunit [UDP-forming] n=1 Tax=Granulicella rosea TaxID=474952 RepID=A0A239EWZ2_9BACT|nr:UDP-forming cellulose synthase catalytic subunit [Granulicella rosea]SNS48961.1 cellulose synthase (UDP-forming) [Granulicella rosea]
MTRSPLWREFESGDSFLLKALRLFILVGGVFFLCFTGILELTWPQQAVLGLLTVLLAIWMDKSSSSYLVTLTLMMVSMFSTFRYGFWRISTTIKFFLDPGTNWTPLDGFFIWLLVGAEAYAFAILFLGYMQTLWPLRRTPVPLPDDPEDWPSVDLLIPTYNEPLSVVRFTALASMNIDWPADKLNVYILDDGKREEFRKFAEDAGIGYMTRDDNKHAKAGNINRAIERLDAPFVAIFDCDHVPTRSFLQVTMGWFLRDRKLAMLQTPHHFYSPDPFERNLGQFRVIPNEGELFYGIVQDGNDFWNATFFCGSCAVLRRTALDEIGGIAVETVTEDAHTSLRMQKNGWNTAYINIPQAAGLATERLSGHVKQRIRWARGMIQILRTDNPLFAPGLSGWQRLCYFNAMSHFLYALPRLIFLTAPLIYLVLGHTNVPGYWAAILAYAFPHLVLSSMTNSRIQGQHRHSFWNEIYETVLAPYIFLPTMLALINPKLGSFNVTAKGGVVNRSFFDARIAQPFLVMMIFNIIGLIIAIPRFFHIYVPFLGYYFYDGTHPGTIVMNVVWTIFNMIILGVATAVAWESQQRRQTVRVNMSVPADVILADGTVVQGTTIDLSSGGVSMTMDRPYTAAAGESIKLVFPVLDGDAMLPATIIHAGSGDLRAQFDPLTLQEEESLTMVLYSRADTWLGWGEAREIDRPLKSLGRILQLSIHGFARTFRGLMNTKKTPPKGRLATTIAPLLLFALLAGFTSRFASAQVQVPTAVSGAPGAVSDATPDGGVAARPVAPGNFDNIFALSDVGPADTIVLRGVDAYHSVYFSVPQTQVVKTATMHLKYHFSPGLIPDLSHLKVSLNGTLFATLAVHNQPTFHGTMENDLTPDQKTAATQVLNVTRDENSALLEATLTMPAEMLVHTNELTFEFIGHYTLQCEDPSHSTLWSHVDASSTIELAGSLLPLQNDLKLLPLPFYDSAVNLHPVVPIVFLSQPSPQALRAAGIVASWFGILTDYRPVHFQVSVGAALPSGNAIVIGESAADLPAALNVAGSGGPTIAMRTNPVDPYSKLLILTGDNANDLVTSAMALTLQRDLLQSDLTHIPVSGFKAPGARQPDDAPRWLSTEHDTPLGDIAQTGDLQGDGSVPIPVYMRIPPDLYLAHNPAIQNLGFHMGYRYNGIPLANESSLQVYMNGGYVSSTPMPHTEKASAKLDTVIPVPVVDMRPFSNSLMMKFIFQIAKKGKCQDTAPLNLQGTILKDSYLDIRDIPHWAILPDLELFANAGYPFTRKADLAETTVVLPDTPQPDEIELFLTFMGHFGAQTGYPVLNVTVGKNEDMKTDSQKDYIVMGTVDQPALARIDPSLPVRIDGGGLHVQDTQGFFNSLQHAWWKVRSSDHIQSGQLETAGGLPDALIEGIEWPSGSNRSVVLIALRDHTVIPTFINAFLKTSQSSEISQSVAVLHDKKFSSYRIGNDVYKVGSLSWWVRINLLFSEFPWIVVISTIVIAILMAALIRAMLRRRARARLQGND